MPSHLPDDAPPPYTETDIYSASSTSGHSPIIPQPQIPSHHRSLAHGDDVSSNDDIIYTPPLTPRSSHSNNRQQNTVFEVDYLTTASAEAYFGSRPAPQATVQRFAGGVDQISHVISVKSDCSPDDFPYPSQEWARRDVHPEDWQTFVNYLIPHHSAARIEDVIDRKLRAEGLSDDVRCARSDDKSRNEDARSPTEAQLHQIRGSPAEDHQLSRDIEDTVREWNDGFFGPRGIAITLEHNAAEERMPSAWDRSFDGVPGQPQRHDGGSRWRRFNPLNGFEGNFRGFRLGGIKMDDQGISIGRDFVTDNNGLKTGSFGADHQGVSVRGRDVFAAPHAPHAPYGSHPVPPIPTVPPMPTAVPCYSHDTNAFYAQIPRPSGIPYALAVPAPHQPVMPHSSTVPPPHTSQECGIDGTHRYDKGGRCMGSRGPESRSRGRGRCHEGSRQRHRTQSSSSTSSSSSSSSSSNSDDEDDVKSLGAFPDVSDLKDNQLPVAKTYLQEWLHHPENVTAENVHELKENLKAAKKGNINNTSKPIIAINDEVNTKHDEKVTRSEVKTMVQQWKQIKRQQKQMRRQLKRERKQERRAEKRERRQLKREIRRARREARHHGHRHGPGPGPSHGPGHAHEHPYHFGRGGFGSFGSRRGAVYGGPGPNTGGFPGMGFGPGARRGRGGHPDNFLPPGFGTGAAGGQDGFQRGMEDFSRKMTAWGQGFAGAHGVPGWEGHRGSLGAWSADVDTRDQRRDANVTGGDHHQASQVKYQAAEAKKKELVQKSIALAKLRDAVGDEPQGQGSQKGQSMTKRTADDLESEIEVLERIVNRLNLEADEQYAKELAAEEV